MPSSSNTDIPHNISLNSLAYFMVAPTLCYQVITLFSLSELNYVFVSVNPYSESGVIHVLMHLSFCLLFIFLVIKIKNYSYGM